MSIQNPSRAYLIGVGLVLIALSLPQSLVAGTGDSDPDGSDEKSYSYSFCKPDIDDNDWRYFEGNEPGLVEPSSATATAVCPIVRDDPDVCGVNSVWLSVNDTSSSENICCTMFVVAAPDGTKNAVASQCSSGTGKQDIEFGADTGGDACGTETSRVVECDLPGDSVLYDYFVGEKDQE